MESLAALMGSLFSALPNAIVDIALIAVAVSRWNKHPNISMLAAGGGGLLLALDTIGRFFFVYMPMRMRQEGTDMATMSSTIAVTSMVAAVLHAIAMGLVVGAVFSDRGPSSSGPGLFSPPQAR
ncbi:MAG: hypothetical protein U0228_21255 [Myxococcaceae bacterium]